MSCLRKPFIPHSIEENVENLQRHTRKAMTAVANNQLVNKKVNEFYPCKEMERNDMYVEKRQPLSAAS